MILDLLDPETLMRLLGVFGLMILGACYGYAKGFTEGKREGILVGKNFQRVSENAR